MKKEYRTHNGKISNCSANVSNMSILEYIKINISDRVFKTRNTSPSIRPVADFTTPSKPSLNGANLSIYLIVYWIRAHRAIKRAKEFVKAYNPR